MSARNFEGFGAKMGHALRRKCLAGKKKPSCEGLDITDYKLHSDFDNTDLQSAYKLLE